jgi:dolichyl-phosphooligosaccharide-protein glycotransferase
MEEEFNIDYSSENIKKNLKKSKDFIIKHRVILLLIIPIFFAIFFRAYTYDLPFGDDLAESSMRQSIISQLESQVIQENPNIDSNTLNTIVQQRYNQYIEQNKEQIEQQKILLGKQIKSYYKDDTGQTYLLAIDPYYYYRQAQNILENGHVGDELVDGKSLDDHMLAPTGRFVTGSLHPTLGAATHTISTWFGNDSLMKSMFILPLIFAALATIPAFFIGRKIGGNLSGMVAAFIVAIHPTFLGRTPAGFSDTDAYGIFFPLAIVWFFLEAFTTTDKKKKLIYGSLAGLFSGIFAYAWVGWWYIFDFILASMVLYFIYLLIKYKGHIFKKIKTKNLLKTATYYILSSAIFVTIFKSFSNFLGAFKDPLNIVFLKEAAKESLWPNVYTTVAELNTVSITNVISQMGGKFMFTLSIVGILWIFLRKNIKQREIKYGLLMIVWFIGTLYTTTKGMRFIMFLVPVFAIGIGIFISKSYNLITNWSSKELNLNKKLVSLLLILVIIFSMIPMLKSANAVAKGEAPSMNDAWYNALIKIRDETQEDAIITSWWDFGHWFKAIADRPVTFDGASQNSPKAHWVGKLFLTDNEEEAIGILRMLDCGSETAYNLLYEETNDRLLTKEVIDKIILEDRNTARNTLSQYITDPDKILENTHCDPPEALIITSEDMVGKAPVWAHFGSWNFERAFIFNTIKANNKENSIKIITETLDKTEEEAERYYSELKGIAEEEANAWIAPYPGYSGTGECQDQNGTIYCTNGVIIDLNEKAAYMQVEGGAAPVKVFKDGSTTHINEEGAEIGVAYIPEQNISVIMDQKLVDSIFTELYYYRGGNLNNFELFGHREGVDGFTIYTWKVKW